MSSVSNYVMAEDCPELLSHIGDMLNKFNERYPDCHTIRATQELYAILTGTHPDVVAIVGDSRYVMLCSVGYGFASDDRTVYEHFIYHIPGTPFGMRKAMQSIEEFAQANNCTSIVMGTDYGDAERTRLLSRFGYKASHQHLTRKL